MTKIERVQMTFYEARRDGRVQGIALTREAVEFDFKIRPNSRRAEVVSCDEAVGSIKGEILVWSPDTDEANGPPGWTGKKLHWKCPDCNLEQWGDWNLSVPNPCLWYSDCSCVSKWLIHWTPLD